MCQRNNSGRTIRAQHLLVAVQTYEESRHRLKLLMAALPLFSYCHHLLCPRGNSRPCNCWAVLLTFSLGFCCPLLCRETHRNDRRHADVNSEVDALLYQTNTTLIAINHFSALSNLSLRSRVQTVSLRPPNASHEIESQSSFPTSTWKSLTAHKDRDAVPRGLPCRLSQPQTPRSPHLGRSESLGFPSRRIRLSLPYFCCLASAMVQLALALAGSPND
jgi:hypothetical protein